MQQTPFVCKINEIKDEFQPKLCVISYLMLFSWQPLAQALTEQPDWPQCSAGRWDKRRRHTTTYQWPDPRTTYCLDPRRAPNRRARTENNQREHVMTWERRVSSAFLLWWGTEAELQHNTGQPYNNRRRNQSDHAVLWHVADLSAPCCTKWHQDLK